MSDSDRSSGQLAKLAVEHWKLVRALERTVPHLPADRAARMAAQARFAGGQLDRILGDAGLRLALFEGQAVSANLPVTVINHDDFEGADSLVVESTIEPAVVAEFSVVHQGKVIARKGDD